LNKAAIGLGSNVGNRESHLDFAMRRLQDVLSRVKVSRWYDTPPFGVHPQPDFLNAAIVGETSLSARALLNLMLAIERERGRERPHVGAPRTLDLDLILFGSNVIDEPGLRVPHPRFRERLFVLEPLSEIAGEWIDPVTGRTISALRAALPKTF
jgi:2-amino-4-hydroxy-6-hydroxymethyldihydropteridine diphosphokinase